MSMGDLGNTLMLKMKRLEAAAKMDSSHLQDCFEEFAHHLFSLDFSFHHKKIKFAQIEFASNKIGDKLKNNPLQGELGKLFVHGNNPAKTVFDITCGSNDHFGTILVTAIEVNDKLIIGPTNCFNALFDLKFDRKRIKDEEFLSFIKELNSQDLLSVFSATGLSRPVNEIYFLPRQSIKDRKEKGEELSGAVLCASTVNDKKQKEIAVFSSDVVSDFEHDEVDDPVAVENENYQIAESRFQSIVERSLEKMLDQFVYYNTFVEGISYEKLTIQLFKDFELTDKVKEEVSKGYSNRSVLIIKNKTIKSFLSSQKGFKKEARKIVKERFNPLEKFFTEEFFGENSRDRLCGYCGIHESEIKNMVSKDLIFTKRYGRGTTMEVDQIIPDKGYTRDNIILSCYWCNNAKSDEFTLDEFRAIASAIAGVWKRRVN